MSDTQILLTIFGTNSQALDKILPLQIVFWLHKKSALEYADVEITNNYVDGEPQVGNFPQQTQTSTVCLVNVKDEVSETRFHHKLIY